MMFMSKEEYAKKEQELNEKLMRKLLSQRPEVREDTPDYQAGQENSVMETELFFSMGQDSAAGESTGLSEGNGLSGGEAGGIGADAGCGAGQGMGMGQGAGGAS